MHSMLPDRDLLSLVFNREPNAVGIVDEAHSDYIYHRLLIGSELKDRLPEGRSMWWQRRGSLTCIKTPCGCPQTVSSSLFPQCLRDMGLRAIQEHL